MKKHAVGTKDRAAARAQRVKAPGSRWRTVVATILLVLGGFVLTTAVLARVYMYEKVAVVPADAEIDAVAETAPDAPATYFDIGQLKEVQGALENRTKIRGDVAAAKEASKELGKDVVVWHSYACTGRLGENCLDDELPIAGEENVVALGAHSSKIVPWSGANDLRVFPRPEAQKDIVGYAYKLPFGVEKRDYTWWNASQGRDIKLTYEGETTVKGLKVYRFAQDVAATKVGTLDIPGSVIGSKSATVTADRMSVTKLRMTVEPETGVQITTTSSPKSYLAVDGKEVLTLTDASLSINDATVAETVKTYKPLSFQLRLLRVWVLPLGVGAGVLLLAAGVILMRAGAKGSRGDTESGGLATDHSR